MSNENHNNSQSWKSKLEELESLPGETMPDKNATWEKLHARVEGRKPRKKVVWYWIAAACMVLLFIIPLIVSNKKDHQLTNTELKQNQPEAKQYQHQEHEHAVAITNHKKDSVANKHPVLPVKNIATVSDKSNQLVTNNIQEDTNAELRVYDTISVQNPIAATIKRPLQAIDTSSGFISAMSVKKRLPVVHNNELGDPADIPPQVARNSGKSSSHFLKLAIQEVYKSSPVSVTKNFATINFKNSPN